MRSVLVLLSVFFAATSLSSQTPPAQGARPPSTARTSASRPDANLAQLMRGILFPSSNALFDVQENDPANPRKKEGGDPASPNYDNVYAGWPSVEGAAAAIQESVDLILKAGRLCSNGKPAPVGRADYIKFANGLRAAGRKALAAANAKNRDAAIESTNDLAEACDNCHQVYRDKGPAGSPARCVP